MCDMFFTMNNLASTVHLCACVCVCVCGLHDNVLAREAREKADMAVDNLSFCVLSCRGAVAPLLPCVCDMMQWEHEPVSGDG